MDQVSFQRKKEKAEKRKWKGLVLSLLEWNLVCSILFFTCTLVTSESAVGCCLTVVMPKSKPNTSRDFFKPRSSEKEGASSGAATLSATSGWATWLQDLKITMCKSIDGMHEKLDKDQEFFYG